MTSSIASELWGKVLTKFAETNSLLLIWFQRLNLRHSVWPKLLSWPIFHLWNKNRLTGQSSQFFHEIAPIWHTHPMPHFWASADHVFCVHPEHNQLSPSFRAKLIVDLAGTMHPPIFFPIFRLCHPVEPVTKDIRTRNTSSCNIYDTTLLLYDTDGSAGN